MQIERIDATQERAVLIAFARDAHTVSKFAQKWPAHWQAGYFSNRWSNLLAAWCVRHFVQYGEPIGNALNQYFESWAATNYDSEIVDMMGKFLHYLSSMETGAPINSEFVTETAQKLFTRTQLLRHRQALDDALAFDDVRAAETLATNYTKSFISDSDWCAPFNDPGIFAEALAAAEQPLFTYGGAIGDFFAGRFARDSFIAIQAPEKRGKTFWLVELAMRALQSRLRVAFFQTGDLSKKQLARRLATRLLRRPLRPKTIQIPQTIYLTDEGRRAAADYETREFTDYVSDSQIKHAIERFNTAHIHSDDCFFRMSIHPAATISAKGLGEQLQQWSRDGWMADVVVVDYADILAPPPGLRDLRDQINETWITLRGISQKLHCCLITATQADAASYATETMTMANFSNDKRKFGHVTDMFGINQTEEEKERGICRLNWLVSREWEFSPRRCCHVAGCLDAGAPVIRSIW